MMAMVFFVSMGISTDQLIADPRPAFTPAIAAAVPVPVSLVPPTPAETVASSMPNFVDLIAKNSPAIVNVSTLKDSAADFRMHLPPEIENSPYGDMLKKFFDDQERHGENSDALSLGSGSIISEDGYILTNYHVVQGADTVLVRLYDKQEFPAKIVGFDRGTDLCLLKIEAKGLPIVKLGDSDKLKVGEWVLAIGAPFGFEYSATAGIVSGKGRSIGTERYVPFIQTDAAINPGNSGGPLFNLQGEVVGINSQILSQTGGYLGLSFAIPVNTALDIIPQLKEKGQVSRAWLGVSFQEIDRKLAQSFGMKKPYGALVTSIVKDSPAAHSDIQVGDVIISFDGKEVLDASQLPAMVGVFKPGRVVNLIVLRAGKERPVKMTLGQLEGEQAQEIKNKGGDRGGTQKGSGPKNALGIVIRALNNEERLQTQSPEGGLLVLSVAPGSIAQELGIRRGDIVLALNMQSVYSVEDFNRVMSKLPKDQWISVLVRQAKGVRRYLAFKVSSG
jgi:serine protease Do